MTRGRDRREMLPQPFPRLRRPLTPILERGEISPDLQSPDLVCTFDSGCCLSAPDPHVIQEHVTSSEHMTGCSTNHLLSDVQGVIQEIRESPRERDDNGFLDRICEVYTHTRQAIDNIERELVYTKQQLKQASEEYVNKHERATSATSRHRLNKGLREVADEKASLWRDHCRNYELGYSQERPELEQLKIVHLIVKATISDLVERNKYLRTFVEILKKKRIKICERLYLQQLKTKPCQSQAEFFKQQFEEALKHQVQIKNIGKPSFQKYLNYRDLLTKFGRNLPRPPFTPLNVFKLDALSPHLGKSRVQYGHGQVCTLKVDINKHLLGEKGTYGRATPEAKENWILAGKNCLKDQTNHTFGDSILAGGMMGYSKLPSIGSKDIVEQLSMWKPRRSIVKRVTSTLSDYGCQQGVKASKQRSRSDSCTCKGLKKPGRKGYCGKSISRLSLNNWGNKSDVDCESVTYGEHTQHITISIQSESPEMDSENVNQEEK